ncbi:MAG: PorV/PorQ family protein, partial [candidate division Zixibacteria bacterium]
FDGQFWASNRSYTVVLDDTPERIADKLAIYGTDKEKEKIAAEVMRLNTPDPNNLSAPLDLQPGQEIRVPYTVGLKGEVTALYAELSGRLWIGTSYGILRMDDVWQVPGYRVHEVQSYQTLAELLEVPPTTPALDQDLYKTAIMDINDLGTEDVTAGQTLLVYRNPAAAPVHAISSRRDKTYFATSQGLLEYDGVSWDKAEIMGLDKTTVAQVQSVDNEIWFAGDKKLVAKANSTTDISTMYVKWLPELADDLYYAFASFASHKEGWGTFGGNFIYMSYGTMARTSETGDPQGTFESFDLALTGSYGTSITDKIKSGVSAKLLYSKLADQGAAAEQGKGTSTGFAVDFGFLYHLTRRLNLGLAITNLGPEMAYIDAVQSDPLPRNLAFGFAYKALQTDYYYLLVTSEVNKSLVGVDDSFREELRQLVLNGGAEFSYASLLAVRAGYIYDQEGDIKTATLGVGIGPVGIFKFDFSYIPSTKNGVLDNILRISFAVQP